ncbi:mitochondrial import receptor subunit TOM7 homolog isoform 1-T1 [Alca torda]
MGSRPSPLAQGYEGSWAPPSLPPPPCPAAGMPKLSKEAKQRLQQLFKGGQFAIRWGFIPVVLYLGFKRGADPGMPEPTIWSFTSNLGRFSWFIECVSAQHKVCISYQSVCT